MSKLFGDLLDYNPDTGQIIRKRTAGGQVAGTVAGTTNKRGYVQIRVANKIHYAHRIAWVLYYGEDAPEFIDHIDGDKANNKICNLRAATKTSNAHNQPITLANTTGFKGVSKARGRYQAQIRIHGKHKHLGYYATAEEAARVYARAARDTHGEFYNEPTSS